MSAIVSNVSLSSIELNASSSAYKPYHERLETYLVPTVFLFIFVTGVIGNVTLIYVLVKEKMLRSPSHLYILNLSLGDLIVILGTVPFAGTIYTVESWPHGLLVCKASEFIRDVSIGVSVMTLSAMSVDRYRAAFATTMIRVRGRPYGPYSFLSSLRSPTGGIMLMIWITAMTLAFPSAYFSFILKFPHPDGGGGEIEICFPFPDELGHIYPKIVVMTKCILLYIIPLAIIACCYVSIATHLISKSRTSVPSSALATLSSHQLQPVTPTIGTQVGIGNSVTLASHPLSCSSTNLNVGAPNNRLTTESSGFKRSRKKSQSRAKMILLLVIIFLVCFFPHHLFMIWFYYHPNSRYLYNDFWHVLRIVAFCLTFLNSTLNPITLYLTSDQFKKLFNKYLWACSSRPTFPTDVSTPSTNPADSPPPPHETGGVTASDKNQNLRKKAGKTCFYRETVFQTGVESVTLTTEDRFGGVFVGEKEDHDHQADQCSQRSTPTHQKEQDPEVDQILDSELQDNELCGLLKGTEKKAEASSLSGSCARKKALEVIATTEVERCTGCRKRGSPSLSSTSEEEIERPAMTSSDDRACMWTYHEKRNRFHIRNTANVFPSLVPDGPNVLDTGI